jgi:hypothetical protein
VVAEVILVVNSGGELEVVVDNVGRDTGLGETRDGDLAVLDLGAKRVIQTTRLRGRVTRAAVRLPDSSISLPVWNEVTAENVLDTL